MDDFNRQFSEQQSFDMHEISPNKPQKTKSRFGVGFVVGIAVGIAIAMAGLVVYGLITYKRVMEITSGQTAYSYDSYEDKVNSILQYLGAYYDGEIDEQAVEDSIASGVLNGIGDRYAKYYSKEEFQRMMEDSSGEYSGVGISVILDDDGKIVVYKVFPGTPAEEAGVHAMDIIVEANGVRDFEDLDSLVAIVRGEEGTTVDITFARGEEEYKATLERKTIITPSVEIRMLDNNIGYLSISSFDKATVSQFNDALKALEDQGMEALILDVRDNPGGDYDAVVAMADRVLPAGTIITTRNKEGIVKEEVSDEEHQVKVPMAVLINGNTASAAELFSGAIQDYHLGYIVGQTSYGKGVVQSIFRLNDGSGMKFTTETYYTPSGRCVDGEGVIPDYPVEIPEEAYEDGVITDEEDLQLQKAIELLSGTQE